MDSSDSSVSDSDVEAWDDNISSSDAESVVGEGLLDLCENDEINLSDEEENSLPDVTACTISDKPESLRTKSANHSDAARCNKIKESLQEEDREVLVRFLRAVNGRLLKGAQYHDINDMLPVDGKFLVDADSLLTFALTDEAWGGLQQGQTLHVIYICERVLRVFARVGGVCELVFFRCWESVWGADGFLALARTALMAHFRHNTGYAVHVVDGAWGEGFRAVVKASKPNFMLQYLELPDSDGVPDCCRELAAVVAQVSLNFVLDSGVDCVDMSCISLSVSTINAYVVKARRFPDRLLADSAELLDQILLENPLSSVVETEIPSLVEDARRDAYVSAAATLVGQQDDKRRGLVRAFLLKCALMETLPFKSRACPKVEVGSAQVREFASSVLCHLNGALGKMLKLGDDGGTPPPPNFFVRVADVWQENFFSKLLATLSEASLTGPSDLGKETAEVYLSLVSGLNSLCPADLDPFPVNIPKLTGNSVAVTGKWRQAVEGVPQLLKRGSNLADLLPSTSQLLGEFCGESVLKNCWNAQELAKVYPLICRNRDFKEKYHWHSKRALLDDDKVATKNRNLCKCELRNQQKMDAGHAYFMQIYGNNLEGNKIVSEAIVRDMRGRRQPQKPRKDKKPSGSATNIRNENERRIQREVLEGEYRKLKALQSNLKGDVNWDVDSSVANVKTFLKTVTSEVVKREAEMTVADLYYKFLKFNFKSGERSRYDKYFADFFLLLKGLLLNLKKIIDSSYLGSDVSDLGSPKEPRGKKTAKRKEMRQSCKTQEKEDETNIFKDFNKICSYFYCLNLGEVADKCKESVRSNERLPEQALRLLEEPARLPELFDAGFPWAQFQLNFLGPHLDRETSGAFDKELGFAPDGWQAELIAAIRRRQSAIVVAPTSSGKTYASYYCMKSVLKESLDGVVVYVSPTKALVNQVAATVYARFKDTKMADGMCLLGVFTRDYRTNTGNCQILVTVPECLEILLLSPRRTGWVRRVRYVIFDEIHCLSGIAGGISWESGLLLSKCPFLALSATIEKPEILERWLREASEYKRGRDLLDGSVGDRNYDVKLIIYTERHNDLEKHVFAGGELSHVHPYTFLTHKILLQHGGVPKTLSLSPRETLQLYFAMKAAVGNEVADLVPEIYFASSSRDGFLTKQQVRSYQSALNEKLYGVARSSPEALQSVLTNLSPGERTEIRGGPLVDELVDLVENLKKKGMLPAIMFSYSRPLVKGMFGQLAYHYASKADSSEEESEPEKVAVEVKTVRKKKEVFLRNRKKFPSLRLVNGKHSIGTVGVADSDDVKYIERRLRRDGLHSESPFVVGLRCGIGMHHGGLSTDKRAAVEMLFRMKLLNVLFATGTLALGIHVPCKTVVIAGETRWLNTLNYHQMAGRAGRRGFDTEGNLVFWNVSRSKISHLMTSKLPVMWGNIPMTVSVILRLLLLVSKGVYGADQTDDERKWNVSRALTFLNCNLVYQHFPDLKQQMRHYFAFSNQLLMVQQLLDDDGNPQSLAGVVTHLHYREPGNLVFVYLLRRGIFNRICEVGEDGKISRQTELDLVLVLSHLFTSIPLRKYHLRQKYKNSRVILEEMPEFVVQEIKKYNEEVLLVFDNYFRCVAKECQEEMGEDNSLPLSGVSFAPRKSGDCAYSSFGERLLAGQEERVICSSFAALSGHVDVGLYSPEDLISTIRHQVFTDMKILPNFDLNQKLNGYAWDFYNHGIMEAIIDDNNLKEGEDFTQLKDFMLVLKALHTSLSEFDESGENGTVVEAFRVVSEKFTKLFNRAYGIEKKRKKRKTVYICGEKCYKLKEISESEKC